MIRVRSIVLEEEEQFTCPDSRSLYEIDYHVINPSRNDLILNIYNVTEIIKQFHRL